MGSVGDGLPARPPEIAADPTSGEANLRQSPPARQPTQTTETAVATESECQDSELPTSPTRDRAERKKGTPWSQAEHLSFLEGLSKLGKGDWRGISRQYVPSRTPTQVASHAQKHFIRQTSSHKRKRRLSLFDLVPERKSPTRLATASSAASCGLWPESAGLLDAQGSQELAAAVQAQFAGFAAMCSSQGLPGMSAYGRPDAPFMWPQGAQAYVMAMAQQHAAACLAAQQAAAAGVPQPAFPQYMMYPSTGASPYGWPAEATQHTAFRPTASRPQPAKQGCPASAADSATEEASSCHQFEAVEPAQPSSTSATLFRPKAVVARPSSSGKLEAADWQPGFGLSGPSQGSGHSSQSGLSYLQALLHPHEAQQQLPAVSSSLAP